MQVPDVLRQIKAYDDQRPSLPGEHWLALGAGALMLLWGARRHSLLATTAGLALLARAASGRDGLRSVLGSQGVTGARVPYPPRVGQR
ncbi:hypothetical protein [Aquincola tertiaricarbonis]|uniref:hypothetical protein n=1 Tax=Aquincola tertiaricarbonis TaxID=391953 RepID=UPI0006150135|nr:hypothetical protein [Aquincola tertiaricarbonis]